MRQPCIFRMPLWFCGAAMKRPSWSGWTDMAASMRAWTASQSGMDGSGQTYQTLRSFLEKEQWESFSRIAPTASELTLNRVAARMILDNHQEIITWLRSLPYYYETERQIFVHAGIDERCPLRWQELMDSHIFVRKYPASTGYFPKDIIAGHFAAAEAAGNPEHEGIYFDGASHYFIDGAVQETGKLLCLAYDEQNGRYYELLRTARSPGKRGRVYGELKPLGK